MHSENVCLEGRIGSERFHPHVCILPFHGLQVSKGFIRKATPSPMTGYGMQWDDHAGPTCGQAVHGRLWCDLSKVCWTLLNALAHYGSLTFHRQLRFPCYTLLLAYAEPYMLLTRATSVGMPMTWPDRSRVHPLSFSPSPPRLLPISRP